MKLKDIQSVTEMERGGGYEMNTQKKCQNMEMPLKWINLPTQKIILKLYPFQLHFHFFPLCLPIHFIDTSSIHFCDNWSSHPFHRYFL